jgi:carboxyl-terminal processing protease
MKPTRRLPWFVISAVVLGSLAGGLYGPRILEGQGTADDDNSVPAELKAFTQIYDTVQREYADPVDPSKAIFGPENNAAVGAIPAMLRTLDPHSNFFDPNTFAALQEDQRGKYYGVGMTITARLRPDGKLETYVQAPIPGSPAFRAGLRPGDVIYKIDGKSAVGMTTKQVASLLKGPKGTQVTIALQREGYAEPVDVTITRDQIDRPTVDSAFILAGGIAYIHINGFDETTDDELTAALQKLDQEKFKGLVLDLRGNPGGLLDEAVEVSDHFLAKGQLIVSHHGRASREKKYYAEHGNGGDEYPMVVLINRNTASAAEIVSGALQDHDRALIMGEPSFGKGLVQTVFPLSDHAGLALTTAHYYTPSGRLIQRDYSDVSLYDYYNRDENGPTPHTQVRLTDGGREVFGGGGITPDVDVPPIKLNDFEQKLADRDSFYEFGLKYLGVHKTIPRDFEATPDVIDEFARYLSDEKIPATQADIEASLPYLKDEIRLDLIRMIYGEDQELRLNAEHDPLVAKAVESMPQAAALIAHAKQYMASREQIDR